MKTGNLSPDNVLPLDAEECVVEYPLWKEGENCMSKEYAENVLLGLSIGINSLNHIKYYQVLSSIFKYDHHYGRHQ